MKWVVPGLVAITVMFGAVQSALADYGAIAYSQSTGKYGTSHNYSTRAAAEREAIVQCGAADSQIQVWVKNGWAALAIDENGDYAFGWSNNSLGAAERQAETKDGSGAHILCWTASGNDTSTSSQQMVVCPFCGHSHIAGFSCPFCSH